MSLPAPQLCVEPDSYPDAGLQHLPQPPLELESRLKTAPLYIAEATDPGCGVMGAKRVTVVFADTDERLEAKWKEAPAGGDGWNNSPRREIGVYEVQKLFLDPQDYLVPPVVARGIAFDDYRPVAEGSVANIDGTQCVYGALAAWLNQVQAAVFDPDLFATHDRYAYHFGNLNLLLYLTDHRDARESNFLMSIDPANPQIFSIDNGIAFGGTLFNFFTWHFNKLRVDRLPRKSIGRLRQCTRSDLDRLGVLSELHADQAGILRHVPPSPNMDSEQGNRLRAPGIIQIGLTSTEIEAIATRLEALLARIDNGELALFD